MSRNVTVSGGQVGQTLEVNIMFDGTDCVPGDKWRLSAAGLILTPAAAQEIPVGATSHTFTWKSATPLPAGLASPVNVQLIKESGAGAGPAPKQTVPVTIAPAPAAPAPAAGAVPPANPPAAAAPATIPQPLQVQIAGAPAPAPPAAPSAGRWINGAGTMGWLGGLTILLVVLAFLWVVLKVITPTAINGLSTPTVPAGQNSVVTEIRGPVVTQVTVSDDPAVLQEAAKATGSGSATISH